MSSSLPNSLLKYKLIGAARLIMLWLTLFFCLLLFGFFGLAYLYVKNFTPIPRTPAVSVPSTVTNLAAEAHVPLFDSSGCLRIYKSSYVLDPSDLSKKGTEVFQAEFLKKIVESVNKYLSNIRKGLFIFLCALAFMVFITVNRTVAAVAASCRADIGRLLDAGATPGSLKRKFTALTSFTGLLAVGAVYAVLYAAVRYMNLYEISIYSEYDRKDIFILYAAVLILGFVVVAFSAYVYAAGIIKKYQYERQARREDKSPIRQSE